MEEFAVQAIRPSARQTETIVQALQAVASAEGRIPLLPIERESIVAIQRHLLHRDEPVQTTANTLPDDLARVIDDPVMRTEVLRLLIMMPFIDQKVLPEKAQVVERAATLLGVEDQGLGMMRLAVKRRYWRITLGIMGRALRSFWSGTGKAGPREWLAMVQLVVPALNHHRGEIRARYQQLEHRPEGSLGHTLYQFYRSNKFPLPGEPKSTPEKFVLHEIYHILSEYPTIHTGEMLTAALTGGNVDKMCMDMMMMALLQYQVGVAMTPNTKGMPGRMRPDDFFYAIARGIAMKVNLMDEWDFWQDMDTPVTELRRRMGILPLRGTEDFTRPKPQALAA
jgi:hypothetical protein